MKNLFSLFVMLLCANTVAAQTTFEDFCSDLNKSGGVYYSYPTPANVCTQTPEGFKPFYISHYGRHGSRYLLSRSNYEYPLEILERAEKNGCLTSVGERVLGHVRKISADADMRFGDLTGIGVEQHRGIAERMYRNYPGVFVNGRNVSARTTMVHRCAMSMAAFCDKLKELSPKLNFEFEMSERNMEYLNFSSQKSRQFSNTKTGPWVEEYRKFEEAHVNGNRLCSVLFDDSEFVRCVVNPSRIMKSLYQIAVDMQDCSPEINLLELFTPQELFDLWQCGNLNFYLRHANSAQGKGIVVADEIPLLENIVSSADSAIANPEIAATLRFGHDTVVVPLLAALQIEDFDVSVSNPEEVYRHWTDFKASPMAANIQIVFYKNKKGEVLCKFLHNEHEVHVPVETDSWPYYEWQKVRSFCKKRIETLKQDI